MKISSIAPLLFGVAMTASTCLLQVEAIFSSERARNLDETGKFEKALKHKKDLKKSKQGKKKSEKKSKLEKKSKKIKKSDRAGENFPDDFWEGNCFFNHFGLALDGVHDFIGDDGVFANDNGFLEMDELAQCVETFAENTYLYIDTDKALDCSESMEKVAWQSYPSCFELRYYFPYFCEELYFEFDKAYECIYDLIYEPACYFDSAPEVLDGCAINFANSAGLDVEKVLDCTIDLYDEFYTRCDGSENYLDACDVFVQCESVFAIADNCAYDTAIDLSDVQDVLEQELEVTNFVETIYDGSVDLVEFVVALNEYDAKQTEFNELEWSQLVECITWEFNQMIDDSCELQNDRGVIEGCVRLFADSFDINAESLLTCDLDIEELYSQNCELQDTNQDACLLVEQCVVTVYGINDCVETVFGIEFPCLSEILVGSEFSDILPSIYDGTVDRSSAFQRLVDYDGPMSEDSSWEVFVACIAEYETWGVDTN